jgi:hypothetical protein
VADEIRDRAKQDLNASLHYFGLMNQLLSEDATRAMRLAREFFERTQVESNSAEFHEFMFYERTFVRALFAWMEGIAFVIREIVLWASDRGEIELSGDEKWRLSEGEVGTSPKNRRKFNQPQENLALACRHFARLFNVEYEVDRSGKGWQALVRAIGVRDGITHPKSIDAFVFGSAQIADVQATFMWVAEVFGGMTRAVTPAAYGRG